MQQDDDEGLPAAPAPRFPYMKRGTGTQKYNGINYPRFKKSDPQQLRPSTTSATSGYPSSSAYVDVDIQPSGEIPASQQSPMTGNVPDSGRGSAAPPEPIYALPSNRSTESGYGGYNNFSPVSPHSSPPRVRSPDRSLDDEVFHPNYEQQASPASRSMQSFIRNEQAAGKEVGEESDLSIPTRDLRARLQVNRPAFNRSQSSNASNPITDESEKDDGPLSSTPIDHATTNQIQERIASSIGHRPGNVPESTIHSSGHTSSSSQPLSSPTTVSQSYQLRPPTEDSLSSARELIARDDRPLHHVFPNNRFNTIPESPTVRPSESTQHRRKLAPIDDVLRRKAFNNEARARKEKIVTNAYSTSSDDFLQTPLRRILPKAVDPVIKNLRLQLRDSVAHVDYGSVHLKEKFKIAAKIKSQMEATIAHYNELKAQLEEERTAWLIEKQREQESYRKDRISLQRREEEFRKLQAEKEQEMSKQIVANRQSVAQMRIQLNKKDQELKRLTDELESKDQMKTRIERTFEKHKTTHGRELKTLRDEIADLQKRLAQAETTKTRQKNGLQSRNPIKPMTVSQRLQASLPLSDPYEDLCIVDPRNSQTLPLQMEHLMQPLTSKKQVQFNLDKNVVYKDGSLADLNTSYQAAGTSDLPSGVCHTFINDKYEITYLYELKHLNGRVCGAKIFKYPNNDAKWIYGHIQLYLFHQFPLIVNIPCLDVVIKVFRQSVEIHRLSIDYMELSKLDRENETLTELRRRRDGTAYYSLRFSTKTGELTSIDGIPDRLQDEDAMTLRRGTVHDPREYVEMKSSARGGYDVYWTSRTIPSAFIKEYYIVSDAALGTKIEIALQDEIINISACPEKDWIIIRHQKKGKTIKEPCCDLGKASRDRERRGEFIAMGSIVPR